MFTPRAFKSNASSPRGMLSLCPLQSALRAVPSLSTVKKIPRKRVTPPPQVPLEGEGAIFRAQIYPSPQPIS